MSKQSTSNLPRILIIEDRMARCDLGEEFKKHTIGTHFSEYVKDRVAFCQGFGIFDSSIEPTKKLSEPECGWIAEGTFCSGQKWNNESKTVENDDESIFRAVEDGWNKNNDDNYWTLILLDYAFNYGSIGENGYPEERDDFDRSAKLIKKLYTHKKYSDLPIMIIAPESEYRGQEQPFRSKLRSAGARDFILRPSENDEYNISCCYNLMNKIYVHGLYNIPNYKDYPSHLYFHLKFKQEENEDLTNDENNILKQKKLLEGIEPIYKTKSLDKTKLKKEIELLEITNKQGQEKKLNKKNDLYYKTKSLLETESNEITKLEKDIKSQKKIKLHEKKELEGKIKLEGNSKEQRIKLEHSLYETKLFINIKLPKQEKLLKQKKLLYDTRMLNQEELLEEIELLKLNGDPKQQKGKELNELLEYKNKFEEIDKIKLMQNRSPNDGESIKLDDKLAKADGNLIKQMKLIKRMELIEKANERHEAKKIAGKSLALLRTLRYTRQAASAISLNYCKEKILFTGDIGVGKTLFAHFLNEELVRLSARNGSFETYDAATISNDLQDSALFGYKKGSFTDAKEDSDGCITRVEGGTLFIDEVGNLSIEVQKKLMLAIEERKAGRLGESKKDINVLFLLATNRKLKDEVTKGSFLPDFLNRINAFEIEIPSFEDRPSDILHITKRLLDHWGDPESNDRRKYVRENIYRDMDHETKTLIEKYKWDNNCRGLRNVLERVTINNPLQIITRIDIEEILNDPKLQINRGAESTTNATAENPRGIIHFSEILAKQLWAAISNTLTRDIEMSSLDKKTPESWMPYLNLAKLGKNLQLDLSQPGRSENGCAKKKRSCATGKAASIIKQIQNLCKVTTGKNIYDWEFLSDNERSWLEAITIWATEF